MGRLREFKLLTIPGPDNKNALPSLWHAKVDTIQRFPNGFVICANLVVNRFNAFEDEPQTFILIFECQTRDIFKQKRLRLSVTQDSQISRKRVRTRII